MWMKALILNIKQNFNQSDMGKEWINNIDGYNSKYKRETLLNYGMNRWGLNKAQSVGATSELIRNCAPTDYSTWVEYYFNHAVQRKKDGIRITREYLRELGEDLYLKLSENVHNELESITEDECIDYVYNLVINLLLRTISSARLQMLFIAPAHAVDPRSFNSLIMPFVAFV